MNNIKKIKIFLIFIIFAFIILVSWYFIFKGKQKTLIKDVKKNITTKDYLYDKIIKNKGKIINIEWIKIKIDDDFEPKIITKESFDKSIRNMIIWLKKLWITDKNTDITLSSKSIYWNVPTFYLLNKQKKKDADKILNNTLEFIDKNIKDKKLQKELKEQVQSSSLKIKTQILSPFCLTEDQIWQDGYALLCGDWTIYWKPLKKINQLFLTTWPIKLQFYWNYRNFIEKTANYKDIYNYHMYIILYPFVLEYYNQLTNYFKKQWYYEEFKKLINIFLNNKNLCKTKNKELKKWIEKNFDMINQIDIITYMSKCDTNTQLYQKILLNRQKYLFNNLINDSNFLKEIFNFDYEDYIKIKNNIKEIIENKEKDKLNVIKEYEKIKKVVWFYTDFYNMFFNYIFYNKDYKILKDFKNFLNNIDFKDYLQLWYISNSDNNKYNFIPFIYDILQWWIITEPKDNQLIDFNLSARNLKEIFLNKILKPNYNCDIYTEIENKIGELKDYKEILGCFKNKQVYNFLNTVWNTINYRFRLYADFIKLVPLKEFEKMKFFKLMVKLYPDILWWWLNTYDLRQKFYKNLKLYYKFKDERFLIDFFNKYYNQKKDYLRPLENIRKFNYIFY